MKISKIITSHIAVLVLCALMLSCNEAETSKKELPTKQTYAEIGIRQKGKWQKGKYENGSAFMTVDSLVLPTEHEPHSDFIKYEGPGWESAKVAYRIYLDWRNAIDIFGKKTDTLVLKNVGQDGFSSYHEDAPWGQDILKAGNSLGIGGYGRYIKDSVYHFNKVEQTTTYAKNTDSQSAIVIDYKNWNTLNQSVDLNSTLTIFPNQRYTHTNLKLSKPLDGLCAGLVKFAHVPLIQSPNNNTQWAYIATFGAQTLVNDKDELGMALFYKKNEVKSVDSKYDHLIVFNPLQDINYYFLAAWQQEKNGIKTKADFVKYLDELLAQLEKNNTLQ